MIKTASLSILAFPVVLGSCFFATKQDFEKLQQDIVVTRASSNATDSVQRAQLIDVSRTVRTLADSINSLSRRVSAMRTASESEMNAMKQDISQLQDLSGQSEQRLRDVRAALEEKRQQEQADNPDAGSSTAAATGPGPLQLLQSGRDQLLRGGNVAARSAFSELITRYPTSEYVPEAMFYTAQAYAAERNLDAADAQYVALISRFPNSPRIPTALYKRALRLQSQKKTTEAKTIFQDIIKRFPRSDEAALADERLQSIR
jgi:tol-pal system protein YbgF